MGLFSRLFTNKSELESELEATQAQYLQRIRGFSRQEARAMARQMVTRAKEEAEQEGTTDLPPNLGEVLLKREKTDENTKRQFAVKRREGVRDEDILWWWNMPDLQRRMMIQDDDIASMEVFNLHRDQGKTSEEAAAAVRKSRALCGDPEDTAHTSGDDRPLPYELKDRINIYVQKRYAENREGFKREIKAASTFNALIRKEIRAGRIPSARRASMACVQEQATDAGELPVADRITMGLQDIRRSWFQSCLKVLKGKREATVTRVELDGQGDLAVKAWQLYWVSRFVQQHQYVPPERGQDFADVLYEKVAGAELLGCFEFLKQYIEKGTEPGPQLYIFSTEVARHITGKQHPFLESALLGTLAAFLVARIHIVVANSFGDQRTVAQLEAKLKNQEE